MMDDRQKGMFFFSHHFMIYINILVGSCTPYKYNILLSFHPSTLPSLDRQTDRQKDTRKLCWNVDLQWDRLFPNHRNYHNHHQSHHQPTSHIFILHCTKDGNEVIDGVSWVLFCHDFGTNKMMLLLIVLLLLPPPTKYYHRPCRPCQGRLMKNETGRVVIQR